MSSLETSVPQKIYYSLNGVQTVLAENNEVKTTFGLPADPKRGDNDPISFGAWESNPAPLNDINTDFDRIRLQNKVD